MTWYCADYKLRYRVTAGGIMAISTMASDFFETEREREREREREIY